MTLAQDGLTTYKEARATGLRGLSLHRYRGIRKLPVQGPGIDLTSRLSNGQSLLEPSNLLVRDLNISKL